MRFERIGRSEGLSNGYVFDLLQDRRGFLWVATADGLNRYLITAFPATGGTTMQRRQNYFLYPGNR